MTLKVGDKVRIKADAKFPANHKDSQRVQSERMTGRIYNIIDRHDYPVKVWWDELDIDDAYHIDDLELADDTSGAIDLK